MIKDLPNDLITHIAQFLCMTDRLNFFIFLWREDCLRGYANANIETNSIIDVWSRLNSTMG